MVLVMAWVQIGDSPLAGPVLPHFTGACNYVPSGLSELSHIATHLEISTWALIQYKYAVLPV